MVDVLVDDSSDTSAQTASQAEKPPRKPRWLIWLRRIGLSLANLTLGGVICLAVVSVQRNPINEQVATDNDQLPPAKTVTPSPAMAQAELADIDTGISDEDRLREADIRFVAGNYVGAEKYYARLLESPSLPIDMLQYRKALCDEKLGRPGAALDGYLSILESPHSSNIVKHAAKLGQARSWVQQRRFNSARVALLEQLLKAGNHAGILASTLHQLAWLTADEVQPGNPNWFDDAMVRTDLQRRDEEYLLTLIDEQAEPERDTTDEEVKIVDRFGSAPRDIQIHVSRQSSSVFDMLKNVAAVVELELKFRADIRDVLKARSVTIDVDELNLATVLDALLEPCGLAWSINDQQLSLTGLSKIASDELRATRIQQSFRLSRDALALFPNHPRAEQTFLCLGNLNFWEKQYADAISNYRELERRLDGSRPMAAVWFNQAKAQLKLNRRQAARDAFFHVIDVARGRKAEPVAYIYLGRLYLDDGDPENANRHLARGLARTHQQIERRIGAITLACGYLLAGNPVAANKTLMDYREDLRQSSYEDQAAFLSALARFRATLQPTERLRRAHDLTAALAAVEPGQFFVTSAYRLVGEAYGEVGLSKQRRAVLEQAIDASEECEMRRHMMLTLAQMLHDLRDWDAARRMFERLGENSGDPWKWESRLGIAQIAFASGDDERCLKQCFELITATESQEKKATILRMMGHVYQRQHDHYKAALCFAGMLPTTENVPLR